MSNEAHVRTQISNDAEREKIARIRAEIPVTQQYRYFNAGTNGPLPLRTHDTLVANAQKELSEGRVGVAALRSQRLPMPRPGARKAATCSLLSSSTM